LTNLLLRALFACALLLLASCSKEPGPVQVEKEGAPALWKASGPKGSAWIFGTVHVLPRGIDWQTAAMDGAIREADRLVLEASGLDDEASVAQIFAHMAISQGQPTVAARVDPALHPLLDKLGDQLKISPKVLDQMESWAAALTLASAMGGELGLSRGAGVERILTLRFRSDAKMIGGLETISEQFGYFDTLPETDQRMMLDAILRGAKDNQETYQKLLGAWMKGNPEGVISQDKDGILASAVVREALLDGRNRNWAKQIAAMIDDGQRPFVAVGAAHVAGKGGVPALLKAAGYRVERVQ
jgi:uncharacterized protein